MRYTGRKGWKASYRDTWNLDSALSPIILAGLERFKEVMDKDIYSGVPSRLVENHDGPTDEEAKLWRTIIDKMIYAFDEANAPDCKDYDYKLVSGPNDGEVHEGGYILWDMVPTNEDEQERYYRDKHQYEIDVQEGLDLFGKYYKNLWT